jgi:hypothetical protein
MIRKIADKLNDSMCEFIDIEIDQHKLHVAVGVMVTCQQALVLLEYPDDTKLFVKGWETALRPGDLLQGWQLYETRPVIDAGRQEVDHE